jgi:hypothetical protein
MTKISNQYSLTNVLFADTTNGRVGVNNGSPSVALDVTGAGKFSSSVTATLQNTTNKEGYIVQASTTSAGGSQPAYTYYTAAGSKRWASFLNVGDDKYHISNASNTELFTITQTGNFGIGTTSPNERLHVSGNISIVSSSGTRIGFNTTDQFSALGTSIPQYGIGYGWSSQPLGLSGYYGIAFFSTSEERMRITNSGKVLIGTTTEAAEANLSLGANNTVEGGQILLQKGTSYTHASHIDNFGDTFRLLYGTNTGTSGVNFQVFHSSGNYSFSGSNVSDKRLKENINVLTLPAIENIKQLVPKTYNMIANPETLRYGFIAQEVQEILPDLITGTESENDVLGLDYNGILTLAVKAIQEQQTQINELKALINA